MTHTASTLARGLLLGLAVTASIATSSTPGLDDLGANGLAALHNGSEDDLTIRITNPAANLDCALLERYPKLLDSIVWSEESAEVVLAPSRMMIPFEVSTDGWTGWPTSDCSVVHIDVDGVGERILFAVGDPDGTTPFFDVNQVVDLSDIGEGVVSIVEDSAQEFRPTSPDLLYEIEDPLPVCAETSDPGPVDCPDGLCFTETVAGGVAFAYDGPETHEAATLLGIAVREARDGQCTDLDLASDAGRRTARFCGPTAAPSLPFELGEPIEVGYAWPWSGARLTLSSATHTVTALATTGVAPSGLRLEPAAQTDPACVDATATCPSVGVDAVDVSMVVGETAAMPGERVTLPDVTSALEHVFEVDLLLGPDDGVRRQEIVSLWIDEPRVSLSGLGDCGAPVDLLMVQTTRTIEE